MNARRRRHRQVFQLLACCLAGAPLLPLFAMCGGRSGNVVVSRASEVLDAGHSAEAAELPVMPDVIETRRDRAESDRFESLGCADECTVHASQTCAEDGDRLLCDDYNADGCLEWGNPTPCPSGLICLDGDCVCMPQGEGPQCGPDGCGHVCGVCPAGTTCSTLGYCDCSCPAGVECGSPSPECPSCGDCADGFSCTAQGVCEPCVLSCLNDQGELKICGNDGCGGSCGACPPGWQCDEDPDDGDSRLYMCELCVPDCSVKECGGNGCGGTCGTCKMGGLCMSNGVCDDPCSAYLDCWQKECGVGHCPHWCRASPTSWCSATGDCPDGGYCDQATGYCVSCDFHCGICPEGMHCTLDGQCVPLVESCDGLECDPGQSDACGTCAGGKLCNGSGKCVEPESCLAECVGRACGATSCGGALSCGECPDGSFCDEFGYCRDCEWGCWDRECGPDLCDNECGSCIWNQVCVDGNCVGPDNND